MPVPAKKLQIKYDGLLTLAVGQSRKTKVWKHKELLWSQLLQRLAKPTITGETLAEYQAMPKSQRDDIKDVGGFVGGTLHEGRRKADSVKWRQLITLDADNVKGNLWAGVEVLCDYAVAAYSTHSHSPDQPRLRLIIPLSRPVTADEYQPIARRIAADLGIDMFDETTYEPHRLMYWPSAPADVEPVFLYQDAPWLNPDDVLARYPDWRDPSYWPESTKTKQARERLAAKQEDPHTKAGIVGAFCRTYSIEEAIEAFLSDVYAPVEHGDGNRYTYLPGTTTGGLVVYEDGKFAYSHHGTDPISGQLVNSFDLVRIHRFGALDDEAAPGTPVNRLPSYTAMVKLATEDVRVKETLDKERQAKAAEDFGIVDVTDTAWLSKLEVDRKGNVAETRNNILLILENDPRLAGRIMFNELTHRAAVIDDLPWRKASISREWTDRDDESLRHYLEHVYQISAPGKTADALGTMLNKRRFHPVRDYLHGLEWDGIARVDTLLIDYLGAEDAPYVRAVIRKTLVAAVSRVMRPGCKWDYVPILVGPQGIGKSQIWRALGKEWFSDSLSSVVSGREAYEQLQGSWIIELGELAAMRKAEAESIKHFITKQEDIYRPAYGRQIVAYPRQCVFVGDTNSDIFLKDQTGNRRFWPVIVTGRGTKSLWRDMTDDVVDQIWAEAFALYKAGEKLYLPSDLEAVARDIQEGHTDESERAGAVRDFLDMLLPENWDDMSIAERREFIHGGDFDVLEGKRQGTVQRNRVCVMEIWVELFQGDPKMLTKAQSNELHDILRRTPGWTRYTQGTGKLRFMHYGPQRAYVREVPADE